MNETERFEDRLEPVGIAVGVLLVLIGLTTIAGLPWTTKGNVLASVIQVVAALGTAGIGALLAWISYTE